MADLALTTTDRARVVTLPILQYTMPGEESLTAGQVARQNPSTGKLTKAKATDTTEANALGMAVLSPEATGLGVTVIRKGLIDGYDLSDLDYGDPVYLSDTDGGISTTPGTVERRIGTVISAWACGVTASADKILEVDFGPAPVGLVGGATTEITVRQASSPADEAFFIANRAYQVVAIREVHSTAGSDGGAVNLQVTKDTGTNAPGAGTDLLTNNTNAGFNLKGTANTVQAGTLTATEADLQLAAGDRLSLDYAGTLTAVAGVVVTVELKAI